VLFPIASARSLTLDEGRTSDRERDGLIYDTGFVPESSDVRKSTAERRPLSSGTRRRHPKLCRPCRDFWGPVAGLSRDESWA
jgi:hypothetical protein